MRTVDALLLLACCGLATVAAQRLAAALPTDAGPLERPASAAADTLPAPTAPLAFEHVADALERPLFLPARRRAVAVAVPPPPAVQRPAEPLPELVGVVLDGGRRLALLRPSGGAIRLLAEGQSLGGRRIRSIMADGITIETEAGLQSLKLQLPNPQTKRSGP